MLCVGKLEAVGPTTAVDEVVLVVVDAIDMLLATLLRLPKAEDSDVFR